MVNGSTYSMVSALQGLQRLEAQIQRALQGAGATDPNSNPKDSSPAQFEKELNKQLSSVSLVLQKFDQTA